MQKIVFNITILSLLCIGLSIHSMKRPHKILSPINPRKKLSRIYIFDLLFLIEQEIFTFEYITQATTSLGETTLILNNLAQVNKSYSAFFLDEKITLKHIKRIAAVYECSHMCVAERLQTKPAKERYKLQNLLFTNLNGTYYVFNKKHCNFLKKEGLDLDFTLEINNSTPLIIAAGQKNYAFQSLATWLIENGANINATNTLGMNTAMIALRIMNEPVALNLLNSPQIDIHHKDFYDNTLFHHLCLGFTPYNYPCTLTINYLYEWWKKLMAKNLDHLLKNKQGKTALDLLTHDHRLQLKALLKEAKQRKT